MPSDAKTPTSAGSDETGPLRPLRREFALEATLHEVFGLGERPQPMISRYAIERPLGAGGMSEVFLARDPKLGREVAVKVLNHRFAAGDQERLVREGWALASVKHPSVVAVHDVGFERGRAFLVMEHVEGRTLDAWLRAAPRSLAEVLRLVIPICEGLARVHERGVVHRDLKPGNILVTDDDHAKVIDFGLVFEEEEEARADADADADADAKDAEAPSPVVSDLALAGTPPYMSPEQALGRPALDGRSDLFSLAIVVYEAAFGERPFAGKGAAVLGSIVVDPPRRPARLGWRARMLWRVLQRALAKDPAARHADLREFGAALERVLRRPRQIVVTALALTALGAALILGSTVPPRLHHWTCVDEATDTWSGLDTLPEGPLRERLKGNAELWSAAWDRGCRAAHLDGKLSVDVGLPLRQACLREASAVVSQAIGKLGEDAGDERARREEELLLAELPSIPACEASASIRGRRPPALGEQAAVTQVAERVTAAEASFLTGDIADAEARAREAVDLASALEHRWSRARAGFALGRILRRVEAPKADAIVDLLESAANDAIADHDRLMAIRALHEAARGAVLLGHDAARARRLLVRAEAELRALDELPGDLQHTLRASQYDIRGLAEYEDGATERAVEAHRQAIDELGRAGEPGDEGRVLMAAANLNLGRALGVGAGQGEAFERARAIFVDLYGEEHTELAAVRHSQALAAFDAGHRLLAQQLAEEGLLLAQGAGPVTRQKARSHALLGQIDLQRGEYASALRHGLAAEAIYAAVDGGRGVPLLNVRRLIAASLRSEGRQDEAEAAEARLVEQSLNDASLGPKQRNEVIFDRAKSKIDQGDSGEALRLLDELERRGGEPSPSVVAARGWALAAGGRQADAIFWLEEGIDQLTEGNHRAERAVTQWILAEALIATGNDRLRICQLLDACREFYASSGAEAAILGPLEELRAEQRCAPAGTNPESETGP